jgi:predicted transcriptional regulator
VKGDILISNTTRSRIYDFILKYPGSYLNEISRKLDIPKSTVNYHLNYLKKKGLIISEPNGKRKRFYDSYEISKVEKRFLNLLLENVPCKIIMYLFSHPDSSQVEISKYLDKHPTTISFHIEKLNNADIIEITPNGNKMQHKLKDPVSILDVFLKYGKNFVDDSDSQSLDLTKNAFEKFYNSREQ